MKKLINDVSTVLTESLDGFAAAHADIVTLGAEHKFVRRKVLKPGKVALLSGGGSGHEPLHAGFVGHGMLDAACPGQVFTSPTPDQMIAAAEAVDTGAGVLFIVKNYEGDVMNFDMAREMGGRDIETVITDDDVAVENSLYTTGRRGVAGTLVVEKIVGAAAEQGADLDDAEGAGRRVNSATRSMGVALTSCTVPAAGKPTFDIGDDEMEMGVGIHGEPGRRRVTLQQRRCDRRGNGRRHRRRPRRQGRCAALRQRLRRHARRWNSISCITPREAQLAKHGITPVRVAGRQLCHLARHGGLLDHRHDARRRDREGLGRAGPHGGAALGPVGLNAVAEEVRGREGLVELRLASSGLRPSTTSRMLRRDASASFATRLASS